jgi:DNA-binding NtrC family response regulator
MPGMDGMEVLKQVKEIAPQTVVIMMTAYASIPGAVQAMQEGAYDYIVKPLDVDQLTLMLKRIVEHQQLITENILLRKRLTEQYEYEDIIGRSEAMQEVFSMIKAVTDTNATVLITGETGTGKELVARAIHSNSSQRYGPFVATSCGALPETLLESELFGYEKGAFTGADRTKKGRFELANGGTLFLDEVGDISMKTQIRLLRVLQEKSFSRLGGTEQIKVDVRLVSATNRDLVAAIEEGSFRSDLYYRLNVVSIQLPPLRERIDDVPLLAAHFINKYNVEFNKKFDRVDRKAMDFMMDYHWPGNVRELENVIERAIVIDQGPQMKVKHLPFCNIESPLTEEPRSLQEVEKSHIEKMLQRNDWNIAKTARLLNIDRSTLHKKIKKFGLERQQ